MFLELVPHTLIGIIIVVIILPCSPMVVIVTGLIESSNLVDCCFNCGNPTYGDDEHVVRRLISLSAVKMSLNLQVCEMVNQVAPQ